MRPDKVVQAVVKFAIVNAKDTVQPWRKHIGINYTDPMAHGGHDRREVGRKVSFARASVG